MRGLARGIWSDIGTSQTSGSLLGTATRAVILTNACAIGLYTLWHMSTDTQHAQPINDGDHREPSDEEVEALTVLLEELDNVDEHAPDAKANEYSISDNNGGRIMLMKQEKRKPSAVVALFRQMLAVFKKRPVS